MTAVSVLISGIALVLSVVTLYVAALRPGQLLFLSPNFVGAHRLGGGDTVILPVSITNTGVLARAIKFKLIVNNTYSFHQHLELSSIPAPGANEEFSLRDSLFVSTPIVADAHSTVVRVIGFTGADVLAGTSLPLHLDLWYADEDEWINAYRIRWDGFGSLRMQYEAAAFIISTEQFTVMKDFQHAYHKTLLNA